MGDEIFGPPTAWAGSDGVIGWDGGGSSSSSDGGVLGFLTALTKTYSDVRLADARARIMTQFDPRGGYYTAGQPNQSAGGSLLPLLLIGGLIIFAMKG